MKLNWNWTVECDGRKQVDIDSDHSPFFRNVRAILDRPISCWSRHVPRLLDSQLPPVD